MPTADADSLVLLRGGDYSNQLYKRSAPIRAILDCLQALLCHERCNYFSGCYQDMGWICSKACWPAVPPAPALRHRRGLLGSARLLTRSILWREWVSQAMNWRSPSTMAAVPY